MNILEFPKSTAAIIDDPWQELSQLTAARIALGRCGASLPTSETLKFALAHAQARDAVHTPLDLSAVEQGLYQHGFDCIKVKSAAASRAEYLQRPDKGRRLHPDCHEMLLAHPAKQADVLFVVGDGLSSLAVAAHALPLLTEVRTYLETNGLSIGPVVLAEQARVALADEVGECLQARLVVMMVGERPGLSSPDSLGLYITWQPKAGLLDSARNCISNVRPEGLGYAQAAYKLDWLIRGAFRLGSTGVALKDGSADEAAYLALATKPNRTLST